MKQLILYFLFFVCAALILIQCARFFPTNNNSPKRTFKQLKSGSQAAKGSAARSAGPGHDLFIQPAKKTAFHLYFTGQDFPLNMWKYINQYQFLSYQYWNIKESKIDTWRLFYNPYTNLVYTGLFGKNDSSFIANNPFDQDK